jgi:hypothetical protein
MSKWSFVNYLSFSILTLSYLSAELTPFLLVYIGGNCIFMDLTKKSLNFLGVSLPQESEIKVGSFVFRHYQD